MAATGAQVQPPFLRVPSSRGVLLVVAGYLSFILWVLAAATFRSTRVSDVVLVAATLYVLVLAVPLVMAPRDPLGWTAPTVFASLFAFVALVREASVLTAGSVSHTALTYGRPEMDRLKAFELGLLSLGFAAYLLVYYGLKSLRFEPRFGVRWLCRPAAPDIRFRAPIFALTMVLVAMTYVVVQEGSVDARLTSLAGVRRDVVGGQHYMLALLSTGLHACWLWLAVRPSEIRSFLYWPVLLLTVGTSYLLTGGRAAAVVALGVAVVVWALRQRSLPMFRLAAGAAAAVYIIAVLGAAGSDRAQLLDYASSQRVSEVVSGAVTGELAQRSTVAGGTSPILAKVPDAVHYRYGMTYVAALLSPVPRALWPEKPGLIDGEVGRTFFGTRAGVPAGPVGEAYWNFGIVGVMLSYSIFGLFHRWLAFRFRVEYGHPLAIVLYAVILMNLPAPTSPAFVVTLQQCALVVAVYWFLSNRAPRRSVAGGPRQSDGLR